MCEIGNQATRRRLLSGAALTIATYIGAGWITVPERWPPPVREARLLPFVAEGATRLADYIPERFRPSVPVPPPMPATRILTGITTTFPLGNMYRVWAKQRRQALYGPRRPFVGLGITAPQTQLPSLSSPYPHWRKPHQHHSAGYPSRSHPGLHLPPNPLGHCSGSEAFRLIPHSFALLAVIGL